MKESIVGKNFAKPLGPYSHGTKAGGFIFVSGQTPADPVTGKIPSSVEEQTAQSLKNVQAVLAAAGATMDDVVKTLVFLADMDDFPKMNGVYKTFFTGDAPARSAVQVVKLPGSGVKVEIEAIAYKG